MTFDTFMTILWIIAGSILVGEIFSFLRKKIKESTGKKHVIRVRCEKDNDWVDLREVDLHGVDLLIIESNETKTCPFCGREHSNYRPWINIICPCGAKYYFQWDFWLDRKTGERRDGGGQ